MEFKNYRELCSHMGLPVQTGRAKILQLERLGGIYEISRDGWRYTFTPKEETVQRPKRIVLVDHVRANLLNLFNAKGRDEIHMAKPELWKALGMVNEDFGMPYSGEYGVENNLFVLFTTTCRQKLTDITARILNNLKGKGLIDWGYKMMAEARNGEFFALNEEQSERVRGIEERLMAEFGIESARDLIYKPAAVKSRYMAARDRGINDAYGWRRVFNRYRVTCLPKYGELGDLGDQRGELNAKVVLNLEREFDRIGRNTKWGQKERYARSIERMIGLFISCH